MTGARDVYAMDAKELGDVLGVSERRVRQLADEGRIRRVGRGRFDVVYAMYENIGARVLGQNRRRRVSAQVAVAAGWLAGLPETATRGDVAAFHAGARARGLTGADTTAAIDEAVALLGRRAPRFVQDRAA